MARSVLPLLLALASTSTSLFPSASATHGPLARMPTPESALGVNILSNASEQSDLELHPRDLALGLDTVVGLETRSVNEDGVDSSLEKRQSSFPYSAVIAFGDSYSDNAHPREAKFFDDLPESPYYKRRWSNGPVAVEYVAKDLAKNKRLYDYAYGSSHINNRDTGKSGSPPDAATQVSRHLSALRSSSIDITSRNLYIYFSGINSITSIWVSILSSSNPAPSTTPSSSLSLARSQARQIFAQLAQVESLRTSNSNARGKGRDYIVLTIPPLQETPSRSYMTTEKGAGKTRQLKVLKDLTDAFNNEVRKGVQSFKGQVASGVGVYTFDVQARWYDYTKNPKKYGLDPANVVRPCFKNGVVCSKSSQRIYWDSIHPTTETHKNLAKGIEAAIRR